jgi:hypothetical protein
MGSLGLSVVYATDGNRLNRLEMNPRRLGAQPSSAACIWNGWTRVLACLENVVSLIGRKVTTTRRSRNISARGFWGAAGGRLAWVLTGGLLVVIILKLSFEYGINLWNRAIFDAIEKRDAAVVLHLTGVFLLSAIGSGLFGVIQVYTRMGIKRRWRAWLTSSDTSRWLKNGRYYQLNLVSGDHQNPEYRMPRTCAWRPTHRLILPPAEHLRQYAGGQNPCVG